MKLRSLKQLKNLKGKRVLLRVDYNVPFAGEKVVDDRRIKVTLPTLEFISKRQAVIILISHRGRPRARNLKRAAYSLEPAARRLGRLLGQKVSLFKEKIGSKELLQKTEKLKPGSIVMLENLRFYPEEERGNEKFARALAQLGDLFVNEAFSVSHRDHASVSKIAKLLPGFAGIRLEEEIKNLSRLLPGNIKKFNRPFIALLGGVKISTKIGLMKNLLKSADKVLLGGALANHFLRAQGLQVGKSFLEKEFVGEAKKFLKNKKIILPLDFVVSKSLKEAKRVRVAELRGVKKNEAIVDIGPAAIRHYAALLKSAKTIVWNGPLGLFEVPEFSHGSVSLGRIIAARSKGKAFGVVGGGETIACLNKTNMAEWVDWVSMGGGAMLAFLAEEKMPGITPLIKSL